MTSSEQASIVQYVLEKAGNPTLYFDDVPEDSPTPAAYFQPPKIKSAGETLSTYRLRYTWRIKFYHDNNSLAFAMANDVQNALERDRLLIPLINGQVEAEVGLLRLRKTVIKRSKKEKGVVMLKLKWDSHCMYNENDPEKMMVHKTAFNHKAATVRTG